MNMKWIATHSKFEWEWESCGFDVHQFRRFPFLQLICYNILTVFLSQWRVDIYERSFLKLWVGLRQNNWKCVKYALVAIKLIVRTKNFPYGRHEFFSSITKKRVLFTVIGKTNYEMRHNLRNKRKSFHFIFFLLLLKYNDFSQFRLSIEIKGHDEEKKSGNSICFLWTSESERSEKSCSIHGPLIS